MCERGSHAGLQVDVWPGPAGEVQPHAWPLAVPTLIRSNGLHTGASDQVTCKPSRSCYIYSTFSSSTSLRTSSSMLRVCLVVIDLQEDFLPPDGSLAVPNGRDILPRITHLLNTNVYPWLAIVVTQDWHPHDHCLFASQHGVAPYSQLEFPHPLGEKNGYTGEVKKKTQTVWPDHCIQGSAGAEVEPLFLKQFEKVDTVPTKVVRKGFLKDREYYLCFSDCWKLHRTEMEGYLLENAITHVVFVGLAYDYCVLNSAVDCLGSGFETSVIRSCCKSVYPEKNAETERLYEKAGVKVYETAEDLMKAFV